MGRERGSKLGAHVDIPGGGGSSSGSPLLKCSTSMKRDGNVLFARGHGLEVWETSPGGPQPPPLLKDLGTRSE